MHSDRFMTIHYLDGSRETYSFPKQAKDQYDLVSKMKSALTTDRITIEVDGILSLIPLVAVKRIDFSPSPATLPDEVIVGAKLEDNSEYR